MRLYKKFNMRLSSLGIIVLCCATGLFFAACARTRTKPEIKTQYYIQKMRQAVSDAVTDHNRKDQMLELVDQMEGVLEGFNADLRAFVDRYTQLNRNYDASREELEKLFVDFQTRRMQAKERIFDLNFEAKALVTADEWYQVLKFEKKAIKEMMKPREQEG